MNKFITSLYAKLAEKVVEIGPKVLLAIAVLIIGNMIIGRIRKLIVKMLKKSNIDETVRPFLASVLTMLMKVALFISAAGIVGIKTSSFVAILGAAGLAIGLALQGSLANFAGGVIILILRPMKIGDFVEAQGVMGVVKSIQIFHTFIHTVDNRVVIIPNGPLANGNIINYTKEETRMVDLKIGVGYDDDVQKVKSIINDVIAQDANILKDPAPFVGLGEFGDSSVNFIVRPWTKTENYWDVHFNFHEKIKEAFDKNGISIPYPQTDVHVHQK